MSRPLPPGMQPSLPAGPGAEDQARGQGAHTPEELLVGFARAVRAAGVPVTGDRTRSFVEAVVRIGLGDPQRVRWAGHATLCGSPEDRERLDLVFAAWFLDAELPEPGGPPGAPRPITSARMPSLGDGAEQAGETDDEVLHAEASDAEVLRHRDVAEMSPEERALLGALLGALRCRPPVRRTHRRSAARRGEVDPGRTVRRMLRHLGEPTELARRRRTQRPRRVVVLVDVSGSMRLYADTLLRLAHAMTQASRSRGGHVETFTLGTRVTRVTDAFALRDPDRALVAAGEAVPDWSGGTRLGEGLQAFLDRWGQRGLVRGAVVVVMSDGWERGDAALLGSQAARMRRLAHRVVWVNPHRGRAGYEPVQGGVVAVLPHVDDFLAGHTLATYAELVEVVARA